MDIDFLIIVYSSRRKTSMEFILSLQINAIGEQMAH